MKKIFFYLSVACLFLTVASCESTEAVSINRLNFMGYDYNISGAMQSATNTSYFFTNLADTLFGVNENGDTTVIGSYLDLHLFSSGFYVDSILIASSLTSTSTIESTMYPIMVPPTDKKFAHLAVALFSKGLCEISEGTYEIQNSMLSLVDGEKSISDSFFNHFSAAMYYDKPAQTNASKVIDSETTEELSRIIGGVAVEDGTITVKKGVFTYDITWDLQDVDGNKITGRYNGLLPFAQNPVIPVFNTLIL